MFGTLGSNICPAGYRHITMISQCEKATEVLAPGHWNQGHSGADYGTANPKGCFYDGGDNAGKNVHFNTDEEGGFNQAGDKPLCEKGEAYELKVTGSACASRDITSSTQCQAAANNLGYPLTVYTGGWGHAPKGCFMGHPSDNWKHLYFNSVSGATGATYYRSICKVQASYGSRLWSETKMCKGGRWYPNTYAHALGGGGSSPGSAISKEQAIATGIEYCAQALAHDNSCSKQWIGVAWNNGHCWCMPANSNCDQGTSDHKWQFKRQA